VSGIAPGVAAEHGGLAGVGLEQAEQDPQGGGLARAVRPEEGVHLTGPDGQVQAVQGGRPAERLAQTRSAQHDVLAVCAHHRIAHTSFIYR
jgi:hypothetical protein